MPLVPRFAPLHGGLVAGLDRTFEALVLDWDGTAVPSRRASARALRRRVEALCAASVDVAIVSGTHVGNIDTQLGARPAGPGRLFFALHHGSELYRVDALGPRLIWRRTATTAEETALDQAAALVVERLAALGLTTALAPVRGNHRKIDLIPQDEWVDPSRTRILELLDAVTSRLHDAGLPALSAVVAVARSASTQAGLVDPKVSSDVKHVEIGLTDKADSVRMLLDEFAARGVGPGLALVVGDEFGLLGGVPGSDSLMVSGAVTAVSVGVEPGGVPPGVRHLPGGPGSLRVLLDEQLRRRAHLRVPWIDEDPGWVLTLNSSSTEGIRRDETLLSLGDGVIGLRGSHEDLDGHEAPLLLAAGVYTGQGSGEHLLEGPGPPSLGLGAVRDQERRRLDLRSGVLVREGAEGGDGIRTLRFVSAGHRGAVVQRAEGPLGKVTLGVSPRQRPDRGTTSGVRDGGDVWARSVGNRGGISMVASQVTSRDAERRTIERLTAYAADPRRPPSVGRASLLLDRLKEAGFERLLSEHRAVWAGRWDDACVWIPDDPDAQLAVRFALFQLWSNVGARGESAVGARGLTGPGYAGHVFWDADVFVLPAMASMSPKAARAMLEYRLRRLPQAYARARSLRMNGARFPWESATQGDDVTPTSGRANGEWVPILTGTLEEHIVADVAWAAGWYADWTGDQAFLTGPGKLLLTDTARYWASRAQVETDGRAHLRHVIGPDEYHEDVDDNAYTNLLAGWNLRRAATLTSSADEANQWLALADALVDGYDPDTHRHEQFAGYYELEPLLVKDVGSPPFAADLLLGAARTSASQVIKQPDVLMAHHLLPGSMPNGSFVADLDFYLPRTAHGSSLSPAISASLLARAGRPDEALALLDIALRLDLDDLTGITSAGLHLATLGGVWQALLLGFAGARVDAGALSLDPHLPTRWGSLRLRYRCLGRHVDLRMTHDSTLITVSGPLSIRTPTCAPIRVTHQAQMVTTETGWMVRS
jgi:trehalose/maltose hydrolase-like predicted phosphorylase